MISEPVVTVYILNYNYAQYLEKCVDSSLLQTYKNIELLVIDDGSTDESYQVLAQYDGDLRINIIRQKNIGLVKSIANVFSLAKGEYVIRIDADDWVVPTFVESLVAEIEKDDQIAMVFPDYYEVDETGHILHRIKRHDFSSDVTLLDQPAHGACTLTRRSAYMEVGGHNQKLQCQDGVDIWLAITEKYKVTNYKEPLFYYRKHRRSLTTNYNKILNNRAMIYRDHAIRRGYQSERVIAFIPVREELFGEREFVLRQVGGRTLLDWTIDKALASKEVSEIVVSTDSKRVKSYIDGLEDKRCSKQIVVHWRSKELAEQGIHVDASIRDYFNAYPVEKALPVLVMLTPNSPFSTALHVDTALYSAHIFHTQLVDSVIEDNSILYYHNGRGLVELAGGNIRHERDNVYIRKGGITVYGKIHVENIVKTSGTVEDSVKGHLVIDEYSSFEIKNMNDIGMADYIARNIIGENV